MKTYQEAIEAVAKETAAIIANERRGGYDLHPNYKTTPRGYGARVLAVVYDVKVDKIIDDLEEAVDNIFLFGQ